MTFCYSNPELTETLVEIKLCNHPNLAATRALENEGVWNQPMVHTATHLTASGRFPK